MFAFLKALFGFGITHQPSTTKSVNSAMDEGDYHSGPLGYSPNTPYQETQYGSSFAASDDSEEW